MSVSEADAFDFAMARFKTAWEAGAPAIVGYAPQILWPDVTTKEITRGQVIVKLVFAVTKKVRMNLGNPAWYHYTGSFMAIILSPLDSVGSKYAKQLGELVKTAFQGQTENTDLHYREVLLRPYPGEGAYHQYRAEVRFEGDERV